MINKGNVIFIFLIYLIIVLEFISVMQLQIKNNIMTLENIEIAYNNLAYEAKIIKSVEDLLLSDTIQNETYYIGAMQLDVYVIDEYIEVDVVNETFKLNIYYEDRIITNYKYIKK